MQTAEYNPKQVQDQTDVDPSGLTGGSTLIWNGSFFETRPADFSDITGTLSIDQFPSDIVVTLDSIDEDALYFFDNTLFAPRLIGAAEAAAFIGLGSLTFGDIGGTLDISQFPPGTAATLDSIGEDALFFYDESLGQPKLINQADAVAFLGITGGDASTNTSSSVDSEVALFSGTGGKTLKRATGSGLALLTSGVLSTITDSSSNWNTAFTERHQWDGGATNLVAATGRTSLGLVIGTNVQAWDADLDALAALSGTNTIYYRSASNTWTAVTIGSGLSFSSGSLTATGTGVAADTIWDAKGDLAVGTGADTAAKLTTGANDTILMADSAQTTGLKWGTPSTVKTALGLVIGTNVQAWDADLDTLASLTATTNNFIVSVSSAWASRTPAQVKTTLAIANTDVSGLGTLSTQNGTFSGTSSGTNTGDQTITLTGDVTGSGTGSFAATIGTGVVTDAKMASLVKPAIAVIAASNVTLSGEQTIDGVLTAGSLVLATSQSTGSQNGPWVSASGAWTRPTWYSAGSTSQAPQFLTTFVRLGTTYQGSTWRMTTASVTIDTTSTTWVQTPTNINSVTGTLSGSSVSGGTFGAVNGSALTALTAANITASTTVGRNILNLTNPGAVSWIEIAADNTVSTKSASQMRTDLGLVIGTNVQAWDADLDTLAGLTATTDNFIVSVSSAWASRTPTQVKTTLGLTIGTNVQAWDADLDTWAGITPAANVGTFLATPSSANLRSAMTDEIGTGACVFDGATLTLLLTLATCGSSLASLNIPAGTVPTTPNDGDLFADANCFYGCTDTGNPGVMPIVHIIRADSTVTQANDANAHAIFTTPTNGRLTLETGCYRFKGLLSYSSMSATSGNIKIDILGAGTATAGAWLWLGYGQDQVTGGGANNITGQMMVSNTSTASVLTGGTSTAAQINIDGSFEVTVAGTIIPTQTVATAAAAVLAIGSFLEFWRVGSTSMTSVGQWD